MENWQYLTGHFNYIVVIILMMTGLYIVIATGNLVKKLVGLGVFQTAVFQLYITMSKVSGGVPPILDLSHGNDASHGAAIAHEEIAPEAAHEAVAAHGESTAQIVADGAPAAADVVHQTGQVAERGVASIATQLSQVPVDGVIYSNPLPHVLILTAIVVGVATLAVGLALVVRIREAFGSIEEVHLQEASFQISKKAAKS